MFMKISILSFANISNIVDSLKEILEEDKLQEQPLFLKVADDFIKDNNLDYMINTEQIPGESAAAKLMKKDKFLYPNADIYDLPLYYNAHMKK